jgi:prephenate dehydratase
MGDVDGVEVIVAKSVAFLGPAGTYTEEAAKLYAPGADLVACASLPDVVAAVDRGTVDEGVAPIENSIAGSINDIVDALIGAQRARITGELLLPIHICLIAPEGTDTANIRRVRSKAEALGQCRRFLHQTLPNATLEPFDSTAGAIASLKGSDGSVAALGPEQAALLHGMKVIQQGVEDRKNNVTRFVVLGRQAPERSGRDKTSIVFDFDREDAPGLVYAALKPFADMGINLTKIESRPTGAKMGVYYFLVDFDGHETDENVQTVFQLLQQHTAMFKVLGSYPKAPAPTV